ncbi:MAG TPA: hypothetical protein VKJ65_03180 [Phycisphaerae bacterium]|nr:hypothetical protein [Phycisphaerae bacterium]
MEPRADQNTQTLIPNSDSIRVPRRHGEVLIEPRAAEQEKFLLSIKSGSVFTVLPEPWKTLSKIARKEFLEAAAQFGSTIGSPFSTESALNKRWIVTGHQVEFYHAGVWAKVLFADSLARRTDAVAFDLLVDHDVVETMGFGVPHHANGHWSRETVAWGEASAIPAEFLHAPGHEPGESWMKKAHNRSVIFSDALDFTFNQFKTGQLTDYTPWMSQARRQLEIKLDIDVPHVPCSGICSGVAWAGFVLAWIRNADAWVKIYNEALDQYRQVNKIKNPGQPIPDLEANQHHVELPFWIYGKDSSRHRLLLDRTCGGLVSAFGELKTIETAALMQGDIIQRAHEFQQQLKNAGLFIRPRALTLTMFVRLLISDLFIHGIGGAMYDRITDQFIKKIFGTCGAYSCVSAGWLLNIGTESETGDAAFLRNQKHHLLHNPQLIQPGPRENDIQLTDLIKQREQLIGEIEVLLKADREQTGHSHGPNWKTRAGKFQNLQKVNQKLIEIRRGEIEKIDQQIAAAAAATKDYTVTHWREYYFAMHSFESLQKLRVAIREG